MSILVISDLHYERGYYQGISEVESFDWLIGIIERMKPSALIGLGDWGYGWSYESWELLTVKLPVHAIYGNHDSLEMLQFAKNKDKSPVLARDGETRTIEDFKFGFINGIISNRTGSDPFFVPRKTDEDFFKASHSLKNIDALCSHESPLVEELSGRIHPNPGTVVLAKIIRELLPRISLSGHVHLKEGYFLSRIGSTLSVLVDSSQASKRFATVDPRNRKLSIWHDNRLMKEVDF